MSHQRRLKIPSGWGWCPRNFKHPFHGSRLHHISFQTLCGEWMDLRMRSITSGWWSNQYTCLVNPWKKYIKTGLRELVGWWIQEADMKLCSLGHRGWAQLPPSLPAHLFHFSASSSILGMQAMVFRSSVTGSIELLNLKMGLWTCKPPILIIWSQACLTWGLMAGIWTEYSWALNLQNLQ